MFGIFSGKGKKGGDRSLADTVRIIKILQQLVAERNMLTIKLAGVEKTFTSTALSIDPSAKTLRLDELTPEEGHALLLKKKSLKLSCQMQGADLAFNAKLLQTGKSGGIAWYDIGFPPKLDYEQRRKHFRAKVKESRRIVVTAHHEPSASSIKGTVNDISNHGICITFDTSVKIERGDRLKNCKLDSPDTKFPRVDLDVRHTRSRPGSKQITGCSFYKADASTLRTIEKFVRKLERDALRNIRT